MGFLDKILGKEKKNTHDHNHDHHGHDHTHDHAHGHDDAHVKFGTPAAMFDPVCKMWVDPAKAPAKSPHGKDTVYFCSPGCKKKFDTDPHKYLGSHSH